MGGRQERLQQSQVGSSSKASIICHFYRFFPGTNTTQITLLLLHNTLHSHLVNTVLVLHLLLLVQLFPHVLQNHIQILRIYAESNPLPLTWIRLSHLRTVLLDKQTHSIVRERPSFRDHFTSLLLVLLLLFLVQLFPHRRHLLRHLTN